MEKCCFVFYINGEKVKDNDIDPEWTLLQYIRDKLLLFGTKMACGQGACGSCTVMISKYDKSSKKIIHSAVPACMILIGAVHGLAVTTVEGVGSSKKLHPVQERLAKFHGTQCGFCSPGMVLSMYTLLRNNPSPSIDELESALQGNLCRCTGFRAIYQGFETFTDKNFDCGMGDQCCQKLSSDKVATNLAKGPFLPYKPDQEPIFPNELQLSDAFDKGLVYFHGKRVHWYRPSSLDELFKLKTDFPDSKFCGAGLALRKEEYFRNNGTVKIISLSHIPEIHAVEIKENGLVLGAGLTMNQVLESADIQIKNYSEKTQVLKAVKTTLSDWSQQIKNIATIGGHIISSCKNSSTLAVLVAANSRITVVSPGHSREVLLTDEFLSGGVTALKHDDVIVSVFIPYLEANDFFNVYHSKTSGVTAAFFLRIDTTSNIIQHFATVVSGVGNNIKLANSSSKQCCGKELNDSMISNLSKSLVDEIKLSTEITVTGAASHFGSTLVLSFLFKFYLLVRNEVDKIHPKTPDKTLPQSFNSASRDLIYHSKKSSHLFQTVDSNQSEHDSVGRPMPQTMNYSHVTGETVYIDDIPTYSNEIFIAFVYSTHTHAKIKNVDSSKALEQEGVLSYIDHHDVPNSNKWGTLKDEEIFASKVVSYRGHIIGVVAAKNRDIARKAAKLVKVEYEDLKSIITIKEAISENSYYDTNVNLKKGDVDAVFAQSDYVIEGEVHIGSQKHIYLETQVALAVPNSENNEMTIYASTQDLNTSQTNIAEALGVPFNRITVKNKRLGGSFGGKETRNSMISLPTAISANKLKRPVRCVLDREEDMLMVGGRHAYLGQYKIGFDKLGKVEALDMTLYSNGGNTLDFSAPVMELSILDCDACYYIPNFHLKGKVCRTNMPSSTGFRGFGRPQALIFTETWMDDIATTLHMIPEKVREINMYKTCNLTSFGMEIDANVLNRCWNDVMEQSKLADMRKEVNIFNSENRWKKRGISVLPTKCGCGFTFKFLNQAAALVHVYLDGSVLITHGGVEMGQGLHSKLIQIASRVLSIPTENILIGECSTDKIPNSVVTAASCSTEQYGMAVKNACEKIVERLQHFKENDPDAGWNAWVVSAWLDNVYLSATGYYCVNDTCYNWDDVSGRQYDYLTYGAACSLVEIDCLTGEHQVLQTDIVMDVGASINPAIDVGQIDGGFMQGYGMFMLEDVRISTDGKFQTNLGSYNVPRLRNLPNKFNVTLLKDSKNPRTIYSSKGIGEPPLFLAATIYFAVKDAIKSARSDALKVGRYRLDIPATAERIRLACVDQFTRQFYGDGQPWRVLE